MNDPAYPELPLTHRSFVNTWECDENDHWNVQFYVRAFQQAAEYLAAEHIGKNPGARCASTRHIRYHRELRAAQGIEIRSARIADGKCCGRVVHVLYETGNGRLAATALDSPDYCTDNLPGTEARTVSEAMPRGLSDGGMNPVKSAPLLKSGKALVANTAIVRLFEMDHEDMLISNAVISRVTDGAPNVWEHVGITAAWMAERNLGRVAVEMKTSRHAGCRPGDALRTVSWLEGIERRTFVLRHQLENVVTRQAVASAQVRCLILDLGSRRSVPLPEFLEASPETTPTPG